MCNDGEKEETIYSRIKKEAVGLVTNQGYTAAETARNLGIQIGILNRWRREELKAPQNAFPGSGHRTPEVEELERLREENRRLKMEREILKKAAVFLPRSPDKVCIRLPSPVSVPSTDMLSGTGSQP